MNLKGPYTWDYFKSQFATKHTNSAFRLKRKPEVEAKYQTYLAHVAKESPSLTAHLIKQFYLTPKRRPLSIDPNLFPYDLAPRLYHWVLWVHPEHKTPTFPVIDTLLRTYFDGFNSLIKTDPRVELVWFRNAKDKQSVKTIDHFHVIVHIPPHTQPPMPELPPSPPTPRRRQARSQRTQQPRTFSDEGGWHTQTTRSRSRPRSRSNLAQSAGSSLAPADQRAGRRRP